MRYLLESTILKSNNGKNGMLDDEFLRIEENKIPASHFFDLIPRSQYGFVKKAKYPNRPQVNPDVVVLHHHRFFIGDIIDKS